MMNIGSAVADGIIAGILGLITDNLPYILGFFIFLVGLFFAFRAIFTWYLKIDKIIILLEKIEENTRKKDSEPLS